ncbi:DNA polymerase III subunit delta [Oceanobacillus arenosus]|uniref:DNA polymerase III subunit delta n=1 Tax=Oceanobacillus arenosus TaxID=1229153 RepID=A0A3D8PSX4_9BACI|nr:DNA polymerase III subunit delta [Oceanobacillus arenosus]RDW19250.1 DNA polymerase III subunit delta [Oceanobacillus arenosus]
MSFMEVMKQVKKQQFAPVYFLYGSEAYFTDRLRTQMIANILKNDRVNLFTYDLEETSIQEVVADAETYPFFGGTKLIIASNPVFLKAKPDKLPFEHDLEAFAKYIENPVDYSILVLIAPYEKIDERKKISKLLKKNTVVANCEPIKDKEVAKWIKMLADDLRITLENDVYDLLETELSTNLRLLKEELEKIALYVGENGIVTMEIAEKLIAPTSNSSALRLVDAVIDRNLYKAIAIFKDLEKMKEEPIALIGLLAFQFRTILRVKLLKLKGYSQFQMQKQLGLHPYVIKIALSRENKFSTEKLENIMIRLADADQTMKQGKMEKGLAFELLLFDLIK